MTQREVAIESGVSYSMISKLESGEQTNPSLKTIEKIASALNVELFELFIPDNDKTPLSYYKLDELLEEVKSRNDELERRCSR